MTPNISLPKVYLVDDYPSQLSLIQKLCENIRLETRLWDNPRQFLRELPRDASGCLVSDLLMPEMTGLQVHNELRRTGVPLTTIILTANGDTSSCRDGFQLGVFDFIEKTCHPREVVERIQAAMDLNRRQQQMRHLQAQMEQRLGRLSIREREVALLLASGQSLRDVGSHLNITPQSVSKHRNSIFEKLQVNNEVELFRVVHHKELGPAAPNLFKFSGTVNQAYTMTDTPVSN